MYRIGAEIFQDILSAWYGYSRWRECETNNRLTLTKNKLENEFQTKYARVKYSKYNKR